VSAVHGILLNAVAFGDQSETRGARSVDKPV
jgi:hypothetical protein